jgi:GNAT superfamily N-acetyltransferase
VVFLAEEADEVTGCIGGVIYPDLYSGSLVATEFFWFVREQKRGPGIRLYKAFEDWAREQGCSQIRMVHLMDSMPDKLAKFYTHFGYEPSEVHFLKQF